jgi:hypothetical protein
MLLFDDDLERQLATGKDEVKCTTIHIPVLMTLVLFG